jgi:hypothetical protein
MNCTGTAVAESRQVIRDSYAAFSRLCASVARADEAIAKSRRIIEQYQASVPAIMGRADEAPSSSVANGRNGQKAEDCSARLFGASAIVGSAANFLARRDYIDFFKLISFDRVSARYLINDS